MSEARCDLDPTVTADELMAMSEQDFSRWVLAVVEDIKGGGRTMALRRLARARASRKDSAA